MTEKPTEKKNDIDRKKPLLIDHEIRIDIPGPQLRLMKKLQFVTKQGFHLRNVWTNSILKEIKKMLRMKRIFGIPRITNY